MKIDIILPFKEIFSESKASAVSLTVKNSIEYSVYKKNIKIFGQFTDTPFLRDNFVGININRFFHFGKNRSILFNYLNTNNTLSKGKKIIEIHNRPYIFNIAIKKISNHPICLHYHNDPTTMKGSKSVKERLNIAKKAAAVYFVSEFIKKKFLVNINEKFNNLFVLPNAIERRLKKQPTKKKEVIFIGRLVPEKGPHLFVESISNIVSRFPEWNFKIIGTSKAGQNQLETNFEKEVINKFKKLGKNTDYLGFVKNSEVQNILKSASILVIPSLWDDPFPLVALEGLSNGLAVIASNRGGLTEMIKENGILIDNIDKKNLENSISKFITDNELLSKYQNKSWDNYIYNQTRISKLQDKFRLNILNTYY